MAAPEVVTLLASAARTTTQTFDRARSGEIALYLVLDLTASGGAISLTPKISIVDDVSGKKIDLLGASAITAISTSTYFLGLGAGTEEAGGITLARGFEIPDHYEVEVTAGNANSQTYSLTLHRLAR